MTQGAGSVGSRDLTVTAPAKLNLSLRITGRRPDGFHELDTWMVRTSLCDEVRVTWGGVPGVRLVCDAPGVPGDERNLAVRAARRFLEATGAPGGVDIELRKRIPAVGGLGGASSDAAAVLSALDVLAGTGLSAPALSALAAELGSDVPFFLGPPLAQCTGRGEVITPRAAEGLPRRALLVTPAFGVSTPWAYAAYAAAPADLKRGPVAGAWAGGEMRNDLEPVVFRKHALLAALRAWLAERPGVLAAMMSGSGSTMFALLDDTADPAGWAGEAEARWGRPALWHVAALG